MSKEIPGSLKPESAEEIEKKMKITDLLKSGFERLDIKMIDETDNYLNGPDVDVLRSEDSFCEAA